MAIRATVFLLSCLVAMAAARWIWVDEGPRPARRRDAAPRREFGPQLNQYRNGFRYKRCIAEGSSCKKDDDCCGYIGEGAGDQCYNPDTYKLARINPDGATCGPNQSGALEGGYL